MAGVTTLVTVAELLPGLKSGCSEETVAVEKMVPATVGCTVTERLAVAPIAIGPRLNVITLPCWE